MSPQDRRGRRDGRRAHRGGHRVQRSRARAAARARDGQGGHRDRPLPQPARARSSSTRFACPRPAAACCASRRRRSSASGLSIAQAGKLLDALDAVDDRLVEIDDRRVADDWEVGFLRALRPAAPVPEDKREGRKNLVVDVAVVVEGARLPRRAHARRQRPPAEARRRAARAASKERDRMRRGRPGAEPGRLLGPRRRRGRDRRRDGRPEAGRRAGAGVLRARRALEAGLRPSLRVGARADPRRDGGGRRADDRRGLDRRRPAAVDRDARDAGSTCPSC